ncbi:MAG: type II toxin-antitoxin system VapC family toxin [Vicinamibacteria bacterium]
MRFVLDCSLVADWFSPNLLLSSAVDRALASLKSGQIEAHAPELLLIEFGHFLTKHVRRREMRREEAIETWGDFGELHIEFHPVGLLTQAAFSFAIEHHATVYDSCYVALAEKIDASVLTSDAGMSQAFRELTRVQLVGDLYK